ncbi:MAG: hypothetical protein V1655_03050 [bacterium]
MKICKKCIIPCSYPDITFKNGVCDLCEKNNLEIKKVLGEKKLLELLTSRKNNKYDCIVPLSGGKDSSYVLFYIAKKLELKPLAAFFDNGFTIELAKKNVENICKKLGVDLITGHATDFRLKQTKEALMAAKYLGKFVKICGNCENNLRTFIINAATKQNIPFIIWGSTDFEDKSSRFTDNASVTERETYGTFKSMLSKLKRSFSLLNCPAGFLNTLKAIFHALKFMYCCVQDNIASKSPEGCKNLNPFLEVSFKNKKPKTIYFFDYIKYDPYKNIETLKKEMEWQSLSEKEARMDCKLHCFVNYQHLKDYGITADGFTLSVLVRHNFISREEAIKKEEILKNGLKEECDKIAKELGVNNIF